MYEKEKIQTVTFEKLQVNIFPMRKLGLGFHLTLTQSPVFCDKKDGLTLQPSPCSPCYIWLSAQASHCTPPASTSTEESAVCRPEQEKQDRMRKTRKR